MIESADVGRRSRGHYATFGVDDYVIGIEARFLEHGTEQRSFVLAVTVAVGKYIRRWMGLLAPNAQFNGYVTDIILHETRQRLHFGQRSGRRCCERGYLLL